MVEKNGISMVFLSYTYATNGFVPWDGYDVVVPYLEKDKLIEDIRRVRDKADTLIVSVHWGNENQFEPTAEQRELAQIMCDEGVDVIIGTHPHVIQPVEWINSDNGNKTLSFANVRLPQDVKVTVESNWNGRDYTSDVEIIWMDASGRFIIDHYPVDIIASDVLIVFVTVIIVGFTAMRY